MLNVPLPSNEHLIALLRNWNADNVVRENQRIKTHGEIFTPTALVKEILNQLPVEQFNDATKTFLDNCCGNGQFLSEVLIKKLENEIDFETALKTIYGVDIMLDNITICQNRLLCGVEKYRHIVEKNIVCADALSYDYSFQYLNQLNRLPFHCVTDINVALSGADIRVPCDALQHPNTDAFVS